MDMKSKIKKIKKPKALTKSKVKKKLDYVFSVWIRTRDRGSCFTCGKVGAIKEMQNGHYISRSHMNTRYDEKNCNTQCVGCNIFKKGNMDEYALKLIQVYGNGILEELNKKKQIIKQFTILEMLDLIAIYETYP